VTEAKGATRLRDLLHGIVNLPADSDRQVCGLSQDSRTVEPGDLFLAIPGDRADGRDFINDAVRRGAIAVVSEDAKKVPRDLAVPVMSVANLREHVGYIADRFYGAPSRELIVVGVTGTNGKTTCTQLLAQALDSAPKRCAVIGTLGYGFPGALNASLHTTPDAVSVHRLLRNFVDLGAAYASMEVSSHALEQARVNGVEFDVAVFTNLTRDHLDYHGDMASYGATKAKLFSMPGLDRVVINADDAFGRALAAELADRIAVTTYGIDSGEVSARNVWTTPDGLSFDVSTLQGVAQLHSPLFGRFNVYNLLAVLGTLLALDIDIDEACARLGAAQPAAGRAERFEGKSGVARVVVDYAHTPDALRNVLQALREHTSGKLWCIFGCGGERDRGKRSEMGRIAESMADAVILADDNPRNELPDAIIADIRSGMQSTPRVIRDRRAAIAAAITEAGPNDVVLVAGKGHEEYQQFGNQRLPYSDRATVKELIEAAA
jgi:UDP-N-acetylmuramoyl-L-alanyl-D-glutamate--2,6-diaminopimelate ligase